MRTNGWMWALALCSLAACSSSPAPESGCDLGPGVGHAPSEIVLDLCPSATDGPSVAPTDGGPLSAADRAMPSDGAAPADAAATPDGGGAAIYAPDFPRLGTYELGSPQTYYATSTFQDWAAKHHINILSGWIGYEQSAGETIASIVSSIHTRSKIGTKMFQYVITEEIGNPKGNGAKTVTLGTTLKKIAGRSGYSDTGVNDGATAVTSATLQDRDGLILLGP